MRIKFRGTRGTRPTPGRRTLRFGGNTTCIEVRSKSGELVVLDSGSGIAELGDALTPNGPIRAHLLVTHTHWDHIQGFPFFAPAFMPKTELTVVGPAGSIKSLKTAFADQMDPAYFPLRLDQVPARLDFIEQNAGEPFEIAGMTVTPMELNHPIVTFGYRLEEDGHAFVFATDNELPSDSAAASTAGTAFVDSMVAWCQGADLLVHDAQFSRAEYASRTGWGHSTYDDALSLAERAGAGQLAFFHHDPGHSDADIDGLVEAALSSHQRRHGRVVVAFPAAEEQEILL